MLDVHGFARLPLSALRARKADRTRDHHLFGLVRAPLGDHLLRDPYVAADYDDLLFSSFNEECGYVFPDGSDPAGRGGPRGRGLCRNFEDCQSGAADLHARQLRGRGRLGSARRRIAEIDAELAQAKIQLAASQGKIQEAQSSYQQALDELDVQTQLVKRDVAARRTMEKLQLVADGRQGTLMRGRSKQAIETQIASLLPAQRASAEAELAEAQVELDKTVVYAGVDGTVEQFALRKGDIVNPLMRPAGILVPADAGRRGILAGFGQIEAQVMKLGMIGEITCVAQPLTIIPMVVTEVQELIAAGQVRRRTCCSTPLRPRSREPSRFSWNRSTKVVSTRYRREATALPMPTPAITTVSTTKNISTAQWVFFHVIDTVGLVHAMILRIQALLLPVQTLVLGGH